MRVYRSADHVINGIRWIVFINGTKTEFQTEEEARNMASKLTYATQAQVQATTLAQVADDLIDLESVYFDRGYNSGGADPIADADVAALGITAANIGSLITLVQQLRNFLNNAAVATGDYDATLSVMRTDI